MLENVLKSHGILGATVHYGLSTPILVEHALKNENAVLTSTGALLVNTGKYTGRSPKDRYIVAGEISNGKVNFGVENIKMQQDTFFAIEKEIGKYLSHKNLYVFDGFAAGDPSFCTSFRVINELASQNLFMQNMLVTPKTSLLEKEPDFTLIAAPECKLDFQKLGINSEAAIIISFEKKLVLIAGTLYSGEMKKAVFSVMNFLLPERGVLTMHCSANKEKDGDETALFFGLSGTGKTTLSADPARTLIGDDEHGWSNDGIFNIEGGCYAKCIGLSAQSEPDIFSAIRFGSVVENVILDPLTREADYFDTSKTENTRASYPLEHIPNSAAAGTYAHPKKILFLTADAFGVLPPIAKLTKEQAMYYFVSGYTAKVAGTERGIKEPVSTFSTCFGSPFLPLKSEVYAEMLGQKIEEYGADVYLINTGWTGGSYGTGKRIKLSVTRAIVSAVLSGNIGEQCQTMPFFNLAVPMQVKGVDTLLLQPREQWTDKNAYDETAKKLAKSFVDNFSKYLSMPERIKNAGPSLQ
jgi:phosphoenolpyruvate carboxykinase (ATP)